MADMLTIGTAAANTYKKALDVTSHNVANVGTDGFSRQRAEIISNSPNIMGTTFLGGGSQVNLIQRIHAEYIQSQLNTTNSNVERYSNQFQLSTQVEGIVASNDDGIQEFMQRFFDAMQSLADNPTSNTNRQLLLDEAGNLESHVNNMSTILDETQFQVNQQVSGLTQEINTRLELIQTINTQVSRSLSSGTQPPNDLLDQRDQAILELSSYIDIRLHLQDDGRIDVHTANGRLPMISDNTLTKLEADLGPYRDENRVEVYMSIGDQREVISNYITGGALGGVLDFRSNMLDKTQNDLGVTLNALTASSNWQHYQGWDLNGDAGQEFFKPLEGQGIGHLDNLGTEDGSGIEVKIRINIGLSGTAPPYTNTLGGSPGDQPPSIGIKEQYLEDALTHVSNMKPREYELKALDINGDGDVDRYEFYEKGTSKPLTDSITGDPWMDGVNGRFDGVTIVIPNSIRLNMQPGDKFLIQPHKAILSDFEKVIEKTDEIAARGQSPIDVDGDGDLEDEAPAPDAYGSNVNMANMASLFTKKLMFSDDNGQPSETIMGGYSTMASNVGMYVRGSEVQLTAQENVHQQIMTQRESISGVSLDEEAANLMRFQQAYEAAAQIIATSQSIFQTLLGAVRG